MNRKFHFFRKKNRIRIFHKCPRGHESRIRKFHSAEILKLPQPFRQLQNSSCDHVPSIGAGGGHTPCWGMHHSAPRPVPLAPVEMVLLCYLLPSEESKSAVRLSYCNMEVSRGEVRHQESPSCRRCCLPKQSRAHGHAPPQPQGIPR